MLLKIGDIKLPMNTNIMALTATAPKTLRIQLSKLFGMKDPVSIILPPCKENIFLPFVFVCFIGRKFLRDVGLYQERKRFFSKNYHLLQDYGRLLKSLSFFSEKIRQGFHCTLRSTTNLA